ncbi:MAG: hypothetical protein JJ974_04850 [Phycisphaerales bacterium]|nr:hypothetical protein [Phycisphaerales bacterium]
MRLALLLVWMTSYILTSVCFADSMHPQDGPHADLRVAIEDEQVRFSVGVNLALLDETIDVAREAEGELSESEAERVLEVFRAYLTEQAVCRINDEAVNPVFERIEIFADPDPGMLAIFPKMGARALIRAAVVMRFDAATRVESVDVTWPAYPLDQLAFEMEHASSTPPRMYFEVVLTANGKSEPARFSHAEPTLSWSRASQELSNAFIELPEPRIAGSRLSRTPLLLAGVVFVLGVLGVMIWKKLSAVPIMTALVLSCGSVVLIDQLIIKPRIHAGQEPMISEQDAELTFRILHERMYRSFDYTSESDIYNHLEFALHGELLGTLYEQIRLSLLQAEEEMKIGVVTRLDPIETDIVDIDESSADPAGKGFGAMHTWRVDGTVYHWGHSHTRSNIYEAYYRVAYTDSGWRLTEHELRSQQRIDPTDGSPMDDSNEIEERLEQLGYPDI